LNVSEFIPLVFLTQ